MTEEEYFKRADEIENLFVELNKEYSLSNNPYKVGDIIKDHIGKGRILKIMGDRRDRRCLLGNMPSVRYYCENLTRKNTINKKEPYRIIHQYNIKK